MLQLRNASISIQLILLLVCVILTWGVAATLVFNLVDYKGMAGKFLKYFAPWNFGFELLQRLVMLRNWKIRHSFFDYVSSLLKLWYACWSDSESVDWLRKNNYVKQILRNTFLKNGVEILKSKKTILKLPLGHFIRFNMRFFDIQSNSLENV